LFLAMQGDIEVKRQQLGAALRSYDRAIVANDQLFYPYLRKGQVAFRLEDHRTARTSLQRSLELLPTAEAHYTLGQIDRASGDRSAAIAHFQEAAKSQSEAGQKAQGELVRLDVQQNPQRYIATAAALDQQGRVWVQVANQTSVPMRDIQVSYAWVDDAGRTRNNVVRYPNTLAAGQADRFQLNLSMPDSASLQRRFQVQATQARVAD
jgi:tetratricopeptide (TPR) repeat protein